MNSRFDNYGFQELDEERARSRVPAAALCRRAGIAVTTWGRWKKWYGDTERGQSPTERSLQKVRRALAEEIACRE
jgi:hypothetical protein